MANKESKLANTLIGVLIILIFGFGGWLTLVKASNSDLEKVEEKADKNTERIERFSDMELRLVRQMNKNQLEILEEIRDKK